MAKIKMNSSLVEIDGDELAHEIWAMVKERLILPYVDLKTEYYDLSLKNRDKTDNQITIQAAEALKKLKVGVKCSTITPDEAAVKEFGLKKQWGSPNTVIRGAIGDAIFRAPIVLKNITPAIRNWKRPITVARHAFGDMYVNKELRIDEPGATELVYNSKGHGKVTAQLNEFKEPGIIQGIYNLDSSIQGFAKSCFNYALNQKVDVWFGTKHTISKTYETFFRDTFESIYAKEYKDEFEKNGLGYHSVTMDMAMIHAIQSEGGYLWACRNYDGDIMSDLVASAFGSLSLSTSVVVSAKGYYLYETTHGTIHDLYLRYLKGEEVSANPMGTIYAWTGALSRLGDLNNTPELGVFAAKLEKATRDAIEKEGIMTEDVAAISEKPAKAIVTSEEFIDTLAKNLKEGT